MEYDENEVTTDSRGKRFQEKRTWFKWDLIRYDAIDHVFTTRNRMGGLEKVRDFFRVIQFRPIQVYAVNFGPQPKDELLYRLVK